MTPHQKFITYIRTKQVFSLRIRGGNDEMKPIHISTTEIEQNYFIYPQYKRKEEVQKLIDAKELEVTKEDKKFYYMALKSGKIDLNLLKVKPLPADEIYQTMLKHLQEVSLCDGSESTEYFDLFLKYAKLKPELFVTVCDFAGRFHSPVSNLKRHIRPNLLISGQPTTSIDLNTAQILILSKILFKAIGKNQITDWIEQGKDVYLIYKDLAKLPDRETAKTAFLRSLFSPDLRLIPKMFGSTSWGNWITEFKSKPYPANKKAITLHNGKISYHNNLAYLLQNTEAQIMKKVWQKLADAGIKFASVHDSIIIPNNRADEAETLFKEVMQVEFPNYFKVHRESKEAAPKSNIPAEVIELQKYYSEQADKMPEQHRKQIATLWQGVQIYLNNPMQLSLYTQQLTELKTLFN